jgi:hypothetical protein
MHRNTHPAGGPEPPGAVTLLRSGNIARVRTARRESRRPAGLRSGRGDGLPLSQQADMKMR